MESLVAARLDDIGRQGYTVIEGVLGPETLTELRRQTTPYLQGELMGRNDFEGRRSERVYALLAKAPATATLVEHPAVLELVDALLAPSYLLSAALVVNVHPGETAQAWHPDDALGAPPRPRELQGVSTMWAIDDFTSENGATQVIPGSHRWDRDRVDDEAEQTAVTLEMPSGSVAVFAGSLLHRGSANRSDDVRYGITIQYCQPWLRQLENMVLAVPPETAARYSARVQELLGYNIVAGTFVGYVDGRHPRKLLTRARRS